MKKNKLYNFFKYIIIINIVAYLIKNFLFLNIILLNIKQYILYFLLKNYLKVE